MWRTHLRTIRGQLVFWYLGVLGLLLVVLGIFQILTLTEYLRSSTAANLRQAAYAELRVLGPCFVQSQDDLNRDAQTIATLLGSPETAVKVVTPSGATLADHGFGAPGRSYPLRLTMATIRSVIGKPPPRARGAPASSECTDAGASSPAGHHRMVVVDRPVLSQGNLILTSVPLGPIDRPVGYAIVARSFSPGTATIRRTEVVFGLGALAALLLAAIVALPIINRALRPLRRIADTAESIAAGNLEQRANLAHSPDEIGRLGDAFDTMVDRLQAALRGAQASEEQMRRFLADASHELRTPVTVLRGMSEVLLRRRSEPGSPPDGALRDMHEEAVRISRLLDDLLTLSRLDAGLPLSPEPVPIAPFLNQFADRYGSAWPERDIHLDLAGSNGALAHVDPDALRRIITNLVDNAARYSRRDAPIDLSASSQDGHVTIAISDAGPGLTQREVDHLFERFYRGDKARSRRSGGSGLGLAIVHALVEQSKGTIQVDSAPERGTTVAVTLPSR